MFTALAEALSSCGTFCARKVSPWCLLAKPLAHCSAGMSGEEGRRHRGPARSESSVTCFSFASNSDWPSDPRADLSVPNKHGKPSPSRSLRCRSQGTAGRGTRLPPLRPDYFWWLFVPHLCFHLRCSHRLHVLILAPTTKGNESGVSKPCVCHLTVRADGPPALSVRPSASAANTVLRGHTSTTCAWRPAHGHRRVLEKDRGQVVRGSGCPRVLLALWVGGGAKCLPEWQPRESLGGAKSGLLGAECT